MITHCTHAHVCVDPINLQLMLSLLHNSATEQLEPGCGLQVAGSFVTGCGIHSRPVARHSQDGHDADHHSQMEQVESNAKARQEEGDTDAEHGPRPGQEQQQGVMDGGEEEGRERQDEPEHRGGEPRVQRQRRQEERRHSLTCRRRLKT